MMMMAMVATTMTMIMMKIMIMVLLIKWCFQGQWSYAIYFSYCIALK